MAYNNSYSGFGTYPFPNYSQNFGQAYGQTPYPATPQMPFQNQPTQPQMQPQAQPRNDSNGTFRYINGIEGAKAYLVAPNSSVLLFDSDSQKFYIKSANQQGQATLKCFEYSEISQNSAPTPNKPDDTNYVTRQEFDSLKEKITAFLSTAQKSTQKEVKGNV